MTRGSTFSSAPTTMTMASPFGLRVTPRCGTRIACSFTPSSRMARTNMPGSRVCFGLGKTARRVTEPVLWSTVTSENFSVPGSG